MTAADQICHEEDRLTGWFHQHWQAVYGYLRAIVRRDHVAEDLTQEVFRRAWQARDRYREQGTARAYLLKIAHRLLIDQSRRRKPEVNVDGETWSAAEPIDAAPAPTDQLTQSEARGELEAAMDVLTPVQRRVLLLRYYGDMSFAQIAEVVDCPLSTTLSHCRRGLHALRKKLSEPMP